MPKKIQTVRTDSLEGLMLKLKLQYFGHLMGRTDSLEKTLMLEKIEGRRWRGQQRMRYLVGWHHRLNGHEFEQCLGIGDGWGSLLCCNPWGHNDSDTAEQLNWLTCNWSCTAEANTMLKSNYTQLKNFLNLLAFQLMNLPLATCFLGSSLLPRFSPFPPFSLFSFPLSFPPIPLIFSSRATQILSLSFHCSLFLSNR